MSPPVPWPLAARVAGNIAGTYPLAESYHGEVLAEQAPGLVARAEELVEAETGLPSHGTPNVVVLNRQQWIDRNLAFLAKLIDPSDHGASAPAERGFAQAIGGRAVAVEAGALLGVMARKVLGQYELVLPEDAGAPSEDGDAVYLVGPNVLAMERTHQLRPSEFRFWLALHECTHRLQFVGIPWMRDYFFGLITELVSAAEPEPGRLGRIVQELRSSGARQEPLVGDSGLLGLLATPRQRVTLDRVQALMSLLEGHGHVVMDRIGERILVSSVRMSNLLKQRRKDPRMAAFFRLTGLEMKMKQYELGERVILAVERQAGWETLARAWESPDRLPTLAEIEDPAAWLSRVA